MMMKFTCNTGELNQGINSALLAVSPKSTLLALEGILVRVTTKEITLMSYNLEMGSCGFSQRAAACGGPFSLLVLSSVKIKYKNQ